ncbi:hypothetical protein TRVL_03805 [Trypanosoma vivax]|nr:hypothetical protein TRVL_03805 [Trypanosoma vivax]
MAIFFILFSLQPPSPSLPTCGSHCAFDSRGAPGQGRRCYFCGVVPQNYASPRLFFRATVCHVVVKTFLSRLVVPSLLTVSSCVDASAFCVVCLCHMRAHRISREVCARASVPLCHAVCSLLVPFVLSLCPPVLLRFVVSLLAVLLVMLLPHPVLRSEKPILF